MKPATAPNDHLGSFPSLSVEAQHPNMSASP